MNSKVVKWFKRQASIRRYSSDKTDEKPPPSNSTSEEKRKHNFPKLSFRKKNKRKGGKGGEFEGALSVIGISKKYSLSVPKEMEANTKEPVTKVPISSSVNFGCISLTNSPNKTDGYSGASAVSYHSSFDYSKENTNESISLSEVEAAKPILTEKEVSEMSKNSNYDNVQSFHSANSSLHTTSNTSYLGLNHKTDSRHENAPIVKMDDICDINSDKEHPEEIQSSSTNNSFKVSHENATIETSVYGEPSSYSSDKIYEDLCDKSLEGHLVKEKCEETELFIKEEMETNDSQIAMKNIVDENKIDAFEEIDRLVRDATSLTEDQMVEMDTRDDPVPEPKVPLNIIEADLRDEKKIDSDNLEEINDLNDSTSENITVLSTDESSNSCLVLSQPETPNEVVQERDQQKDKCETDCCENNVNYNDHQTIPQETPNDVQNENHIKDLHTNNDIDESPKLEKKIELIIKEESELNDSNNSNIIPKDVVNDSNELKSSGSSYTEFSPSVQIVLTQSSPVKNTDIAKTLAEESPSKSSGTHYPRELNPFGDDDSDSADEIESSMNENMSNREVSPRPRNRINKENGLSHVGRETSNNINVHTKYVNERSSSPMRGVVSSSLSQENRCTEGNYMKALNPFGDSDDEGVSSLNSTNPFDEEDEEVAAFGNSPSSRAIRETPPNLPPKSSDLQTRKNSRGSLAPIPIPRRSKQSLHGSYTSLQNVSTAPIPAPRSITPYGSTKTLNISNNPFDDDETENSFGDFERRAVGRSSMQVLPVSVSQDHLSRTGVRGSLPPSAKLKLGKKKRPAPLPPGFSQRKQHLYPSLNDFSSLPRKRSSTSPATGGRSFDNKTSREISPHRLPPPRPPPPKINF